MSSIYWAQWSHAELMSLHGIEVDYDSTNDNEECEERLTENETLHLPSLTPFDIDGLTYRDFL